MNLLEKIVGPKSKYDKSLPYTYEARIRVFEGDEEYNSYFADTICGLVQHLHGKDIKPDDVQIFEVYREFEAPIAAQFFTTLDNRWLFKPDICRAFEEHYRGHILQNSCSFKDRDCEGHGPC